MKKVISFLSKILSSIIPTGKVFVFFSYPDYTDNAYAIYKHICKAKEYNDYKLVWIVASNNLKIKSVIKGENSKTRVCKWHSILSFWYFYRAKYLFFTHSFYSVFKLKQSDKRINLWHGMPLKNIGYLEKTSTGETDCDYLIVTSPMFQKIMAAAFAKEEKNVFVIGQPRNDLFVEPTDFFDLHNINRAAYKSIGAWLPTYRMSDLGGQVLNEGKGDMQSISFLSFADLKVLDDYLVAQKTLLIVKLHPMDLLQQAEFPKFKNLLIFKQSEFKSQLYPFLGATDFLLTDYSSIWVDYDIMSKPIGFVMDDVEEYQESRGFAVDNLLEILPGPLLTNMVALQDFIANPGVGVIETDQFNLYKDSNSSERLMSALEKLNS